MTLADFLRARLDEDEAVAREAFAVRYYFPDDQAKHDEAPDEPSHWHAEKHDEADHYGTDSYFLCRRSNVPDRGWYKVAMAFEPEVIAHVVRHDPARVLREVKAKRDLLLSYEQSTSVLATLAVAYADHPDYRDEWRP